MCLFVVEDSPADARILLEELRARQMDYLLFRSGDELFRFLESRKSNPLFKKPSLFLLDINLPGCSGLELLQKLREDPDLKTTPIAMLSTSGSVNDRRASERLGADAYFTKPLLLEDWDPVLAKIRQLAERQRP